MLTETLIPNADGSASGVWVNSGASTRWEATDDYAGGGSQDFDTTFTRPGSADQSAFFLLTDTASDFAPSGVSQVDLTVACRRASAGVSGGADVVDLYGQLFKSDETTPLTDEVLIVSQPGAGAHAEHTVTLTNPDTTASKADWDDARLRLRQDHTIVDGADSTALTRISAAKVLINWEPTGGEEHSGSASISGGGSLSVGGSKTGQGAISVSGGGAPSALGTTEKQGSAPVTGGGEMDAQGAKRITSSVSIAGGGEASANGQKQSAGSTSLSAGGEIECGGNKQGRSSVSVSGGGSIAAEGGTVRIGTILLPGGGAVEVFGQKNAEGSASIAGGGSLIVVGGPPAPEILPATYVEEADLSSRDAVYPGAGDKTYAEEADESVRSSTYG